MGWRLAFGGRLAVGRLACGLAVGRDWPRLGSSANWIKKVGVIDEWSLKKSKKTRESVRQGRKHCNNHQNLPIWRSAAVPPGTLKGGRLWSNFIEKTILIAEKSFKNAGGVSLVKFHLKTKGFSREVPQKVEKASHESAGREREHCKL